MKQVRKQVALWLAIALVAAVGVTTVRFETASAARTATTAVKSAKARNGMRQFTGYVTALDKTSLTVQRRGKNPRAMVFTKHEEMKTSGDIEKDARVTVYYRDDGGRSVAHRVVVKAGAGGTASAG
jgi:tagatose-1,6-bisphosphate aldolase